MHLKITYATLLGILGFVIAGAIEWGRVKAGLEDVAKDTAAHEQKIDRLENSLAVIETQVRNTDKNTERILHKLDRLSNTPQ